MLSENIEKYRKAKGMSQSELAQKLHVVRQTVSKWEKGLSAPDADLLIKICSILEVAPEILLETKTEPKENEEIKLLKSLLQNLEAERERKKQKRQKLLLAVCILALTAIPVIFIHLYLAQSPYLLWDMSDPETAVEAFFFHAFEWTFVRTAPLLFAAFAASTFCLLAKLRYPHPAKKVQ
jgi:putative transcriptional regulator